MHKKYEGKMTINQTRFGKTLRQKIDSGHDREKIEKKYGKEAFLLPAKRKFPMQKLEPHSMATKT